MSWGREQGAGQGGGMCQAADIGDGRAERAGQGRGGLHRRDATPMASTHLCRQGQVQHAVEDQPVEDAAAVPAPERLAQHVLPLDCGLRRVAGQGQGRSAVQRGRPAAPGQGGWQMRAQARRAAPTHTRRAASRRPPPAPAGTGRRGPAPRCTARSSCHAWWRPSCGGAAQRSAASAHSNGGVEGGGALNSEGHSMLRGPGGPLSRGPRLPHPHSMTAIK